MRMLLQAVLPHEPINTSIRNGSLGKTMQRIMEEIKPEAAYFTVSNGKRTVIMVVTVSDPSKVPAFAEPFFLQFNADVSFNVVMSPEELGKAGLDSLGKKWA